VFAALPNRKAKVEKQLEADKKAVEEEAHRRRDEGGSVA